MSAISDHVRKQNTGYISERFGACEEHILGLLQGRHLICINVCVCVCVRVCVCLCLCVCMCDIIYVCVYIYN